jgi:predicted transcriptional regulator
MTLTLELAPDVEDILRRRASQVGQEEKALAAQLLARMLVQDDLDWEATVAAIQEGIADGAAGREQRFEQFTAQARAARVLRHTETAAEV